MLTCYDYQSAQIFDEVGIPLIFIGDTLGIFVLGYDTTLPVTMDDMVHHCQAVARGVRHGLVVGDLPFGSYEVSPAQGVERFDLIEELTTNGIPVMGHLGLTPQSFHALGGNKVQARTVAAAAGLLEDALRIEEAGACSVLLEAVPTEAARCVTEALHVPTIGIGAGPHCDGQVLVSTEMLGLSAGPSPRFAKRYADLRGEITTAVRTFADEVAKGEYPGHQHSYDWAIR
jgi:3-methyl-2-oxobutanoate hydroxymethyltransferase